MFKFPIILVVFWNCECKTNRPEWETTFAYTLACHSKGLAFANDSDAFHASIILFIQFISAFYGLSWDNCHAGFIVTKVTTPATLSMLYAKSCQLIDKLSTVSVTSPMQNRKSHIKPISQTLLFIEDSSQGYGIYKVQKIRCERWCGGVRGRNQHLAGGAVTNLGRLSGDISVPFVTSQRADLQKSKGGTSHVWGGWRLLHFIWHNIEPISKQIVNISVLAAQYDNHLHGSHSKIKMNVSRNSSGLQNGWGSTLPWTLCQTLHLQAPQ